MDATTIRINIYQGDDAIDPSTTSATDFGTATVWTRSDPLRIDIRSDRSLQGGSIGVISRISIGWNHERNTPKQ